MSLRDDGNETERPRGLVLSFSLERRPRERGDGEDDDDFRLQSRRFASRMLHGHYGVDDYERFEREFPREYVAWMRSRRQREMEERVERERERAERQVRHLRGTVSLHQELWAYGRSAKFSMHKAEEGLEQVIAAPDFDPTQLFLKRVTACVGWAVHGLVFEYVNRTRMGYIIDGSGVQYVNLDDEHISRRQGLEWTDIHYGDYIVGIHGNRLANPNSLWFCHTVELEFASGKTIRYEAKHEPWRGEPFSHKVPQPCLVYRVTFGHGQQEDVRGLITSLHLPLSAANLPLLPLNYQQAARETWKVIQQVDEVVEARGQTPLGDDLWWYILGMLASWQLPSPPLKTEEDRLDEETHAGLDEEAQSRLDRATTHEFLEFLYEEAALDFLGQHRGGDEDALHEVLFSLF